MRWAIRAATGLDDAELELPTPCDGWTVRDLLNYVIGSMTLAGAILSQTAVPNGIEPGGVPSDDLVGDDPVSALSAVITSLLLAAGGGALTESHSVAGAEVPGAIVAGFTALDLVIHTWDLDVALGRAAIIEPAAADTLLEFCGAVLDTGDRRPPASGGR